MTVDSGMGIVIIFYVFLFKIFLLQNIAMLIYLTKYYFLNSASISAV